MKLAPLALAALTALTTFAAPQAKAEDGWMRHSNEAEMKVCVDIGNKSIEHLNNEWLKNPVGPQPRRINGIIPIPVSMFGHRSNDWPGHIKILCGGVLLHHGSNKQVRVQLWQQEGSDGDYWDRHGLDPSSKAIATQLGYAVTYNREVARYNGTIAAHNAEVDRQNRCWVHLFRNTYDICTGEVIYTAPTSF